MRIGKRLLSISLGCLLVLMSVFSTGGFISTTVQAADTIDAYEPINPLWNSGRSNLLVKDWLADSVKADSWIRFNNVDFGTVTPQKFEFRAALRQSAPRPIKVLLGSLDGQVIGSGFVQPTGSWDVFTEQHINLNTDITGQHDIFIIFNEGGASNSWGGNFNWFRFAPANAYEQIDPLWAAEYEKIKINASGIYEVEPDSWVRFKSIDFGDTLIPNKFEMEFSSASTQVRPMEIRLDSLTGPLLGNAAVTHTGGWETFKVEQFTLEKFSEPLGVRDVYIKFNIGRTGFGGNFKWFRFLGVAPLAGLHITAETVTLSSIGQTSLLQALGVTENGSHVELPDDTVLTYESNNTQVVTVNEDGVITAQGLGTATVTVNATLDETVFTASIIIEVVERNDVFYYVSPNGSDENSGTLELPFKTISKAQDVVRSTIANGMIGDVIVYLRGGEHYVSSMITFDENDSGRDGYIVQYVAYPGETPIIDGGMPITDWEAVDENIFKAPIGTGWIFDTMLENDIRSYNARHPNKGEIREDYLRVAAPKVDASPFTQFRFNEGEIPDGLVPDGALEVYMWAGGPSGIWNWTPYVRQVASIDYDQRIITLSSTVPYEMGVGSRYYIRGSQKLLDAPGEYYIDRVSGDLYYWPREASIQDQNIVAAKFPTVIQFRGSGASEDLLAKNMKIEGLTIRNSNSSSITLHNAKNITINDNHIHGSGNHGIDMTALVQYCTVYGNLIHDIGRIGVRLEGSGTIMNHNQVINNVIHNVGVTMGDGHGIRLNDTQNNIVTHNRIYNSTRYGISIKRINSTNNLIQYNDLFDLNTDSQDTGIIEMWNPGAGNIVDHNRLYNSEIHFSYGFGIYLDDNTSYTTVTNNIIHGLQQSGNGDLRNPILSKGIANQILNNFLVNNQGTARGPFGSYANASQPSRDLVLARNIFYNSGDMVYNFTGWNDDRFASADYQLIYNENSIYNVTGVSGVVDFDEWRAFKAHQYDQFSLHAHPRFMDEAKDDYRLRYDSPARKLGIQEIDFANMGLLADYKFGNGNDPLEYIYPMTADGKTLTVVSISNEETTQMNVMGRTVTGYIADLSSAVISYESSDSNIAVVDASGLITGVSSGMVTITVTVTRGSEVFDTFIHVFVEDQLDVVNVKAARSLLEVNEKTLLHVFGESELGKFSMFPIGSDSLVLTNMNPEVISIDNKGEIIALSSGTATIEAAVTINDVTTIGLTIVNVIGPINAYLPIYPTRSSEYSGLDIENGLMRNTAPGSWVVFKDVNFFSTIPNRLEMDVAVPASHAGSVLEVRVGSPTGQLLGSAVIEATDGWADFQQQIAVLNNGVTGIHDVYLIFSDTNNDIAGDFRFFRFNREIEPPSAPWQVKHYGDNTNGTIDVQDGTYTIVTNGYDIWGPTDRFTFMYQNVPAAKADSMSVIATIEYVESLNNDTSAGVMIRDTSEDNSFNVTARIKPNGHLHLTYRNPDRPDTWFTSGTPTIAFPATLKLTREGDVFTGYYLNNNGDWVQYGQITVPMSGDVMAGVNAFSRVEGVDASFTVSNVSIETLAVPEYTLTKEATTNGTITFDPAKDTYEAGETVTVTATPESGYRLVNFTGASTSTTSPVTITMDADMTIGAIFEPIPVLTAKGVIDRPATAATVSGTTAVTGWFLDGGVAVEAIEVLMNGEVVGAAQYGITRNDVASAYPDYANSNAGFHYALNTTAFANGSYTLSVKVTDVNGDVTTLPGRTIVVANVLKAFGTIDRPSVGADISGRAPVTGWFLNDKGVEKLEVLIDGTVVGEATYGITRNDVAAAYPVYNNAAVGYQYILDTAAMTNGEYTLSIEVTDLEGNKTTVDERTVTVNNVLASIGTIDYPSNNAQVNGIVVVRGWYLDPNDVEKIEIMVDEDVMGEAVYGITRNDVFAVYGAYNNAQSGYYYMLDTTTLINGGYTLTIKVTDTLGNVKTLTRSIVVENE